MPRYHFATPNTNSYALKTSIYREVFHLSSSWYFSYLVFSSSFHQTVGPRNGWGEGGSVSFRFLAPGNAARVFLQPGPRGNAAQPRAGAARGVARGVA